MARPSTQAAPARRGAAGARSVLPSFALYGEAGSLQAPLLHVESIDTRSSRYDWEIDAHTHQGLHQVLWVRHGRVEALLDESRVSADGPLLLAIPSGVAHAFRFSPGTEGRVLTFYAQRLVEGDAAVGEALARLFTGPRSLALAAPDAERLDALFALLHEAANAGAEPLGGVEGSPPQRWLASALLWQAAALADHQARRAAADQAPARRRGAATRSGFYTRFVALVEAHHAEHWPVTRYAERLGLSVERLNRLLRAETGLAAQTLIHHRLVREATRRLVHVVVPVSRLAFELGFEDPAYFCRFFKRHTGLAPGEYRARLQQAEGAAGEGAPADAADAADAATAG